MRLEAATFKTGDGSEEDLVAEVVEGGRRQQQGLLPARFSFLSA
jgi:hypothetical protein